MNKKYFTWVPFYWNNGAVHCGPHLSKNWSGVVTVSELSYNGQENNDSRYLGIVEGTFPTGKEEQFKTEGSPFGVTFITEAKVQELLDEWYGADMVVLESDGSFTDNRPEPEM